jgi:hypothetical protein
MQHIRSNLLQIFNDTDVVYVAGPLSTDAERPGYTSPAIGVLAELELKPEHQFFSINPLTFDNRNIRADGTIGSYRASCNVVQFKNFLLESDSIPIEVQKELIPLINTFIPIRLATFSGSKSIHMIISVADTLFTSSVKDPVQLYKQIWDGLCEKLETIIKSQLKYPDEFPKIFDRATKDPSRLSRLPGALRNDVEQRVVYRGGLVASDELLALSSEARLHQYDSANTTVDVSLDLSSFERSLRTTTSLSFLRDRLEYPDRWTSSANMYTEMFRYTLWCLDATSVPFNVLDNYLTRRVYPSIMSKGYPRDPRAGVLAAYQYKGLL